MVQCSGKAERSGYERSGFYPGLRFSFFLIETLSITGEKFSKGAFDWEIRISQSNAKSENGFHLREIRPQGGFQLRNPNPDFLHLPFCRSIGKSEKGFAKLFS